MPAAQSVAVRFTITARPKSPNRSTPLPSMFIPAISATTVSKLQVIRARVSAAIMYPTTMPPRLGADSMKRRAKPLSKSRAIAKPVNTPPKAADWSTTNTNWNAV